ncbi:MULTISPECIES: transketolase family protein [unclassified Granulicatella]|uniref:transketolase family protein n=1 Tax=unclassified Granulicatella TaxID=2630493 RepID=UPI0010735605|nr:MULTISPECIES: transketolase C-terminal domain-containing protein [unclassified Granulicatella]MBF0779892.1 transketolase family protein [Granulicatella sp. 19428wC4_WM01]TFU96096.1 transketolase family protein [Granulicatella sp. WM01]
MEMRKMYAQTIEQIAKADPNVFVLEADLSNAIATQSLKQTLAHQYINLGIMEANMMGVAAGISVAGGVCFVHTFGQFATRRAFDQIFVSLAYAKQHVVIVGSDAGVSAEHNGGTHMCFEDTGLMRLVPHAHIYDVADEYQLAYLLKKAYKTKGVHYLRIMRKQADVIYTEQDTFENGSKVLRQGTDVTCIANGICLSTLLQVADELTKDNISVEVIDCYRLKPLDTQTIITSAQKTNLVITCENHNVIGGLGSAVAETLSQHCPTKLIRLGVQEQFGQVGKLDYLKQYYHIDTQHIIDTIRQAIQTK